MFIFDIIKTMLLALGLAEGTLIGGVLALVTVVAIAVQWVLVLVVLLAVIFGVWSWVKRGFYWAIGKEMPEEEPPGTKTARKIKKWFDDFIDDLAEKELRSKKNKRFR